MTRFNILCLLCDMLTCKLTLVEPVLASASDVSTAGRGGEAAVCHCLVTLASVVPVVVVLWQVAPRFMKNRTIRLVMRYNDIIN